MALFTKLDDIFAPEIGSDINRYTQIFEEAFNVIKAHTHASGDGQPPTVADGSITESKLASGSVTADKLGASSVTEAKLGALAVTAAKLAADAVETAKIKDGAITNVKRAAPNLVFGADFNLSLTGATETEISTVTITSTGKPIEIFMDNHSNPGFASGIRSASSDNEYSAYEVRLYRGSTHVSKLTIGGVRRFVVPPSSIKFLDTDLTAGERTYSVKWILYGGSDGVISLQGRLAAREL